MADSTKGTEEKGLGEQEQSLTVVVAPVPTVPPEDSSDNDIADEDDEYSLPSDPCPSPSPSPKRRKKVDDEEDDKDYIPPKEGPELIRNFHVYLLVGNGATAIKTVAEEKSYVERRREGELLAPNTARAKFSSQCGIIVREKIPITVKDWDHVSNGDKEVLWKELKKIFQFLDGSEIAVWNCALQTMAKSWRGWKTTLSKKFVKTGCTPFWTYANITPNQWDDFLTLKNSPEEIQRSQKLRGIRTKGGAVDKRGGGNEEEGATGTNGGMDTKIKDWVRARTLKITDEGKVSFEDPKLQSVADKIENLSSSEKKGLFKPKREKDVLSTVLGTPEHGGRVRGVSSKMSWKKGFKHDPHKKREAYKDKLRDEGAAEFERQMMDFCVKHMILPHPETKEHEPDYPFDDLMENTPCRLHVPIGHSGKTLEAAIAIAIPGRTYNEEFIPDAYAKVQPQVVHEGFESYDIDFSTADGVSVLGDAVDLVILWHKNDISFGLGTDATQKPVVPKPGLGKPPRPPKRKVTDKAEEPKMQKENPVLQVPPEIAVPAVAMEIPVPNVPMEITVAEPEVQFVASVGSEIEEVPGLEWDGTKLEIFENPSPAKDPEVQETTVPEKATTSSEVPRVLRSHDSKSKMRTRRSSWMQYMDAKKKKEPIGFLDPTRIYQTQHTLPRLEYRTSFDDTGIKNVQRDLCHFINHECCHVKGDFFDPEGALATSDEFKDLREWNSAMP
uniref:Transposon protein, putative, CACTA, En/Spm sub-class n=1 Tax=Oryza sativa subsp. japonica TaxID=39947 RepID=Q2QUK5_ORYSJ|nr:transposon protein, putative, CACTA, En/Spm sub-class [Oryza sativa Japonica Group]